jgi:hypothetical protein
MWISTRLHRWLIVFSSLYDTIPKTATRGANIVLFADDTSIIVTKLMHNRLLLFLKRHNILTCEQHGFMESKSTETASHSFIQCPEALDRHLCAVGIFLDLSKAYDVINDNRLLDKLDSYEIRGSVNKWFQS